MPSFKHFSNELFWRQERKRLDETLSSHPHLHNIRDALIAQLEPAISRMFKHGDMSRWQNALQQLPVVNQLKAQLDSDLICLDSDEAEMPIETCLQQLHPWRKGPYSLFGVHIDTEWRSDWKWQRLSKHLSPLQGRSVLDVGCGSAYHMWRMRGAGADLVMGVDPTPLFAMQFAVFKHYLPEQPVYFLPFGIESMPDTAAFDTVFSMGVLYHRRSPLDHLQQLRQLLRPGGELLLETLYIEGNAQQCLLPEGRYAKMRNVWFIPSIAMLECMLKRTGFRHIRCLHAEITSIEEQRTTPWMRFESLADFLDPNDHQLTIEGYPAPKRVIFIAERSE